MQKQRENWVDLVKGYACILVVLGHFVQSMLLSNIIPRTFLPLWFNQTIYYFHVPLFFICSGYLYQKYSRVETFLQWKTHFLKKLLSLGIPFVFFAGLTWGIKVLLPGQMNIEVGGFVESLFIHPISPYWYLYALFFIFIVTPTFRSKKMAMVFLLISLVMKAISFLPLDYNCYPLSTVLQNQIWFAIGMNVKVFRISEELKKSKRLALGSFAGIIFIGFSVLFYIYDVDSLVIKSLMGVAGCCASLCLFVWLEKCFWIQRVGLWFSRYTLPIYLMHTIFAAGIRSVLFKLGATNSMLHIFIGLVVSFVGPIVAAFIMSKIKYLDFVLYPTKYIKIGGRKNG